MLPKMVPRIMPSLISRVSPNTQASRFDDESYLYEMENMFRNKFADNLRIVVDILEEGRTGQVKNRSGEEGRLARLITSTLETINVDISDFDGSKMTELADLVSGVSPRAGMYNMMADTLIPVFSTLAAFFMP